MDDLGLPMSFGKQTAAPSAPSRPADTAAASSSTATRGESSSRGPRGIVGAGKKSRGGRGRGAHQGVDSGWAGRAAAGADNDAGFNEGVKRPHPSSQEVSSHIGHPSLRPDATHGHDSGWSGAGRGRGGRGSGRGGRGVRGFGGSRDGRGGHGDARNEGEAEGFFKPSMCEDPWQPLIERQQRAGRAS